MKSALDGIIGLVDGITKLVDTFGTLPTLAIALTAFSSFKGVGIFKTIEDEATLSGKRITNIFADAAKRATTTFQNIGLKTDSSFKTSLDNDIRYLNEYLDKTKNNAELSATVFDDIFKNASTSAKKFAQDGKLATEGIDGFIQAQKEAQVSTLAQNKSLGNARAIIREYYTGCKNVEMSQESFANAVSKTNPELGKQLTTAKSARGAFTGYVTSLIGAKVATVALEVATMAMNAALTMGVSALVSLAVKALDELITTSDELAEKVEEVTSKYKEQHGELTKLKGDYDTSNETSMINKYAKLSKGVDSLGRNVSLTTEEYSEYQSIVNKIADQIPSLVSGYDSQGNALLSCKGNVEELTAAYEKLIHAQNQEVLSNSGNIEKDFANTIKESKSDGFFNQKTSSEHIEALEYIYKKGLKTEEDISKYLNGRFNENEMFGLTKALEDAGVEGADFWWGTNKSNIKALAKQMESDSTKIKGIVDDYYAQFADAVEEQKTIAQAKLSEAFDVSSVISGLNYGDISEELQTIANQTVNSLDLEFFEKLQEDDKTVEDWTSELLRQLNNISETDNAKIETGFDLQTQFNGGEISYGEYVDGLKDVEKTIKGLNLKKEAKNQLKISLGLDDEGVIDQYTALVKRLSNDNLLSRFTGKKIYDFDITKNEAENLLSGLSSEELSIAVDVITEMSDNGVEETIDEVRAAIDRELAIQGLTLELDIEVEKTKIEALTTALTESFSGSGLSSDAISAVEGLFSEVNGYDPSKLFERTANGIKLNNTELRRLNDESKKTNMAKINKEMDSLGDIYNQTREELYQLTYGTDEYNDKAKDLSDIEAQIKSLEQLSAQYEGLTSAYQEWQMAESAGSQRDMYETMLEGWENVGDEISRGWIDDGTREFLELLKGESATIIDGKGAKKEINIATASVQDLKKVWKDLDKNIKHTSYSVRDFFTVDEDGNSTSKGVYNFLDAIGQLEEEKFGGKDVVKRDKNGNIISFDFQTVGGDKVVAEALGISEELVQIMKRAAADAGFVVSFDGTYQQLDVLKEKAQEASQSLNKILEKNGKKGYEFNFNTTKVDDIKKQLTEAQKILDTFRNTDGTINTKLEGADEALTVASTLQSMLDKLTRPAYMEVEVSQVEDEIQEPLKSLQELRTLTETEHQLKLSGADTSKLEASKKEIYDYFETLDADVKVKLGLVDDKGNPLTGKALQDKLNSGDIAIEATIDLQMEMDEKLGILVDKALYDAGIIDKKEFTKRVNVYLEADVDNDDAKDKTENAVNEVTGGEKREQNVKIIAKTLGVEDVDGLSSKLEGLDDKTIQAIAEVLGKVEVDNLKIALSGMSDVQVQAIAEAIGKGDVEGLKTAIGNLDSNTVQAIAQAFGYDDVNQLNTAIENLDPKIVQAVAQALGLGDVNTLKTAIDKLTNKNVKASATASGKSEVDSLRGAISKLKDKTVNVITNFINKVASGGKKKAAQRTGADPDGKDSEVNGTANVNGTTGRAYKQGTWGTKNSGTALVGELGRELVRF